MKLLYTIPKRGEESEKIKLLKKDNFDVVLADKESQVASYCSTMFFDVVIIDSTIDGFDWLHTIKSIREKQIFTPIIFINKNHNGNIIALSNGADICIDRDADYDEFSVKIKAVIRRNTIYQSPTINFEGVNLQKADGKICYGQTSFSVNPIEIEIFRLLTRAIMPIAISKLSKKIKEPEDKILFFAECLQKKIWLLNCPISLDIKNEKCKLVKRKQTK